MKTSPKSRRLFKTGHSGGIEIEAEMFSKREGEEKQGWEFWIERARVSKPKSQGFYSKLNEHLAEMDFARQVGCCVQAHRKESRAGDRDSPVVYLKMVMVGFFENLRSERAIAARVGQPVGAFPAKGLKRARPITAA